MISAMPAVAVRRERKKQQAKRAAAASRANSLSSLGTNSTRSTSLSNNSSTCHSAPSTPHAATTFLPYHPYYNYYSSRRGLNHQSPAPSIPQSLNHPPDTPHNSISPNTAPPSTHGGGSGGGGAKRSSSNPSVSTITSAATSYVSALHRVRERQLDAQRERARFVLYTGSVLITAGLALVFIGLAISLSASQTIGLLFVGVGSAFCLVRYFCLGVDQIPMVKRARTVSGQSIYNCGLQPSAATTPGTDDSQSSASSYYFSALPLHRMHLPLSPHNNSCQDVVSASYNMTTPTSSGAAGAALQQSSHHQQQQQQQPFQPPLQPPPPAGGQHGGSSGGGGGLHRDRHSIHSNASSLLTPMSLNSIPEMQVLITDDSQRY